MRTWDDFFRRKPPMLNFAIGMVLFALTWRLDHLARQHESTTIFYLIPIIFVSWFSGEPWSYMTAFIAGALAAAARFHNDIDAGRTYSVWFIPYWNAVMRLGFYMIVPVMSKLMQRLRRLNNIEHEASQLKSDMVALVSHEFGNSLTSMRLALTLLREAKGEGAEAQRAASFAVMDRVIAHLTATTANFLNLIRLEGGRFRPHLKRTHMRTVAHEALALLGPIIDAKNVALRLDFPSVAVPVCGDPVAMSVVMVNLIGNAFKYTPDGGTVTIRIAVESSPAGSVLITVEDTGIGIAPEDHKKILSGDYRARGAMRIAKGYGVGLRVVSELLESQGSALGVESEAGKSTRFSFRLPMWHEPAGASEMPQ
jgi:signal transduction histidine kinase